MRSHSCARARRWCAARTRNAQKRERNGEFVPARHVTVRKLPAGNPRATSHTDTGGWCALTTPRVRGRPRPAVDFGVAAGCADPYQTVVFSRTPTAYVKPCLLYTSDAA